MPWVTLHFIEPHATKPWPFYIIAMNNEENIIPGLSPQTGHEEKQVRQAGLAPSMAPHS